MVEAIGAGGGVVGHRGDQEGDADDAFVVDVVGGVFGGVVAFVEAGEEEEVGDADSFERGVVGSA